MDASTVPIQPHQSSFSTPQSPFAGDAHADRIPEVGRARAPDPPQPEQLRSAHTEERDQRTTELLVDARAAAEPERGHLRERAVQLNLPVADSLARRYRYRGEDLDDLTQVARMGLVQAVRRFDPDTGAFLAFAVPTITGEIKRHFRDHCWTVRPPRRLQELHSEVSAAWSDLAQQQSGTPTAGQIADWLGADTDDVQEAIQSNAFSSSSLDAGDSVAVAADVIGSTDPGFEEVEDESEREQLVGEVAAACDRLPDQEREVLRMRFEEGRSQSSIAAELGISQMSVSRRLHKITATLHRDIRQHRHHTPAPQLLRNRAVGATQRR